MVVVLEGEVQLGAVLTPASPGKVSGPGPAGRHPLNGRRELGAGGWAGRWWLMVAPGLMGTHLSRRPGRPPVLRLVNVGGLTLVSRAIHSAEGGTF